MAEFPDDQELILQFKEESSREAAFTRIIRKYQEKLYWHIRRLVIQHEDTHDVLQNVFIKAWNHLLNFRGESSLYTWLYRISTNESLSFLSQQKRRKAFSLDSEEKEYLKEKLQAENQFDPKKIEWKLQLAIQELPEKQRIVFNLRYFEEMPYEEMSRVLQTSEGALKASYHHAVKKVEEYLLNR